MTSSVAKQKRFNRVHAVCREIKGFDAACKLCPMRKREKGIGWTIQGCVFKAQEVINVARYGNPWGKKAKRKHIQAWRRRFNRV